MTEFDAIRDVLNRLNKPTFHDEDEMDILTNQIGDVAVALQMLLDQVE